MNQAIAPPITPNAAPIAPDKAKRPAWRGYLGWALLALMVILPLLPPPLAIPDFRMALLGRFLCYAIVAIGIDLIWGYTGLLSLGHGVYFGLGAYCMAMHLKLVASGGKMPDFMAWSGLETLPLWWLPFNSPLFAILAGIAVPCIVATILGFFSFRSRVTGVFFSILSQALALVFVTWFVGQQGITGGTNGMTNFKTLFGLDLNSNSTQRIFYWVSLLTLAGVYLLSRRLVTGKTGKILQAVRDGENRVRFTGYDPAAYKMFVYSLSAAFAGLAGMLFVLQVGLITPTQMDVTHSVEMVLWVAIGGRGTLSGAILGAMVVNAGQNLLSESFPTLWSYFLGAGFLIFVLFMPNGIVGLWNDLQAKWKTRSRREPKPNTQLAESA